MDHSSGDPWDFCNDDRVLIETTADREADLACAGEGRKLLFQ